MSEENVRALLETLYKIKAEKEGLIITDLVINVRRKEEWEE